MTVIRDCTDPDTRAEHLKEAAAAVTDGGLIVLPTDTVYGIGADAFTPAAVNALLAAKGRGRYKPPPVLIAGTTTMRALATQIPESALALAEEFWPGPLTLVLTAQPSLMWDLGETKGTVALRVPDNPVAMELLAKTGPLAVSSANLSGQEPALTCEGAVEQLGESVALYLDGGEAPGQIPSTILDCTGPQPVVLRQGAITLERLREVVSDVREIEPDPNGQAQVAEEDQREAAVNDEETAPE